MAIILTSKQRAYLKGLASNEKPLFSIGKSNLTPEITNAVAEAFSNREIIKVNILKSTADEQDAEGLRNIGEVLAERTGAVLVCNIGRKLVFYTDGDSYEANMNMDDILKLLPDYFIRCHRSYIVNINHVSQVEKGEVILRKGERIPVSRANNREVKDRVCKSL